MLPMRNAWKNDLIQNFEDHIIGNRFTRKSIGKLPVDITGLKRTANRKRFYLRIIIGNPLNNFLCQCFKGCTPSWCIIENFRDHH